MVYNMVQQHVGLKVHGKAVSYDITFYEIQMYVWWFHGHSDGNQ